jgi:hypothetical protein
VVVMLCVAVTTSPESAPPRSAAPSCLAPSPPLLRPSRHPRWLHRVAGCVLVPFPRPSEHPSLVKRVAGEERRRAPLRSPSMERRRWSR